MELQLQSAILRKQKIGPKLFKLLAFRFPPDGSAGTANHANNILYITGTGVLDFRIRAVHLA